MFTDPKFVKSKVNSMLSSSKNGYDFCIIISRGIYLLKYESPTGEYVMEPETVNPEDQNSVTVKDSENIQTAELIFPDDQITIDETINSIREIYKTGVINTIMNVGALIFEKIYENDDDSFYFDKTAKKDNLNKWQVFQQLLDKSEELAKAGDSLPRKTWLYNAVRLFQNEKTLSNHPDYCSLSISHKIEILKIENIDEKLDVAKEIQSQKLSVKESREYISSLPSTKTAEKSFLFYIKNPHEIKNDENIIEEKVKAISNEKKKLSVIARCNERINEIEDQISKGQESVINLKNLIKKIKGTTIPDKKSRKGNETKKSE